jgi:hypothetical protein
MATDKSMGEARSADYAEKSTQLKTKLTDSIRANKDKPLTGSARVYRDGKMQPLNLSKKRDEIVKSGKPAVEKTAKKAAVKKTAAVEKPAAKETKKAAAKPAAKTTKKAATTKVSTKKTK